MINLIMNYLKGSINKKQLYLRFAKTYLKYFYATSHERSLRIVFQGKRLMAKHKKWLFHNNHPFEDINKE